MPARHRCCTATDPTGRAPTGTTCGPKHRCRCGSGRPAQKFGDQAQTQPPQIAHDLVKLKAKGAKIYVVEDALRERGIGKAELIAGLDLIPRRKVAKLYADYDQVWQS
jgi:hypothetical protein